MAETEAVSRRGSGSLWRRGFDPAPSAAALALGVVACHAEAFPWYPVAWLDSLANEWIACFALFFLALHGVSALLERATSRRGLTGTG